MWQKHIYLVYMKMMHSGSPQRMVTFDLTMTLWSIDDFGGWDQAYKDYFDDDAWFDEIYNY